MQILCFSLLLTVLVQLKEIGLKQKLKNFFFKSLHSDSYIDNDQHSVQTAFHFGKIAIDVKQHMHVYHWSCI